MVKFKRIHASLPNLPVGVSLRTTIVSHEALVSRVAWSPDGQRLATIADDGTVSILNADGGFQVGGHQRGPSGGRSITWSPDGKYLAAAFQEQVLVWNAATLAVEHDVSDSANGLVRQAAWSPAGPCIAVAFDRGTIIWDRQSKTARRLDLKADNFYFLGWTRDGRNLLAIARNELLLYGIDEQRVVRRIKSNGSESLSAAESPDRSFLAVAGAGISLFSLKNDRPSDVIEMEAQVWGAAFSPDSKLLISVGHKMMGFWKVGGWELLAQVDWLSTGARVPPNVAFHPREPLLALPRNNAVYLLDVDTNALTEGTPREKTAHYANAKVVLVGNSSVGKSGLGLVLSGRRFRPTESTHGRHVWIFSDENTHVQGANPCSRETLLWDLAGQPGYRLIHQLHLAEVSVALVLFDSRSETDPFAGVAYWARALDQASRGRPLLKFLVASRADRGGPQVSRQRIDDVMERFGFSGFFETSAKRGLGVPELRKMVARAIPWAELPHISASETFKAAKDFVLTQKRNGQVLLTESELLARFRKKGVRRSVGEDLFLGCLGRLETVGLVRRLSFGSQVLLQPERLDDYCGWLAHAARAQPDGLGYIREEDARHGRFPMDKEKRLPRKSDERNMLLAMVEETLGHNIALREETEQGAMLVFPSELSADLPDYPGGYSLAVAFHFEGPVSGIYAALAVSLIHSTAFSKKALYRNAALFTGTQDRICGFAVEQIDRNNDARARLTVFFHGGTERALRLLFLRYVNRQLQRLAFKGSVRRERLYHCTSCDYTIPVDVIDSRKAKGYETAICPVGGEQYPLDELAEESADDDAAIGDIERTADEERERQTRLTTLSERQRTSEYHVFLCHNNSDKPIVRQIAQRLREQGVLPWFDEDVILAGERFAPSVESAIDTARVVAVIVGPQGIGRWQDMEYQAALQRSVERRDDKNRPAVRVIPVLLPGVAAEPKLPVFLRGLDWIDLRTGGADNETAMRRLVAAILASRDFETAAPRQ